MNALWRRILELFRPAQLDREAVEELSHHVDLLVERNMSAGLEPIEARRQALAEVGTVASARERMAEGRSRVAPVYNVHERFKLTENSWVVEVAAPFSIESTDVAIENG